MSPRMLFGYVAVAVAAVVVLVLVVLGVRILTLETPGPPGPKTREPYYVVKRGDVLFAIAQRTGVPVADLRGLNPDLDPLALTPGERIRLRASAPLPSTLDREKARRRGPRGPRRPYYIVKQGDAMSSIADKTGVPLQRLLELNKKVRADTVVPGQRIKLRQQQAQP